MKHEPLSWISKNCVFPPQAGKALAGKSVGKYLLPFQKKILKAIFKEKGGINKDVYIFGCRKISKSLLYSWTAFFLLCDSRRTGYEVPVTASVFNQGLILHRQIESQITSQKEQKDFKIRRDYFLHKKTMNKIHVVYNSTDSNLGLQSSAAIFDEIGAYKDSSIIDTIQSGQSLSQGRPLNLFASNPPKHPHHFSVGLLKALQSDPGTEVFKFSAPVDSDWESPSTWEVNPFIKEYRKNKNPLFKGVYDFYKREIEKVKQANSPEKETSFRRLLLGQVISQDASVFIEDDELKTIPAESEVLLDRKLRFCVALDLSTVRDFTAVNFMLFDELNEKLFFYPMLYLPKIDSRLPTQARIFQRWNDAGFITIQNSPVTDKEAIVSDVFAFIKDMDRKPEAIVFEQAGSSGWLPDFKSDFKTEVVRYRPLDVTESVNKIQRIAKKGHFYMINENPCVRWQLSNCSVSEKSKNYRMINRLSPRASIDTFAALSMGMKHFLDNKKRVLKPFWV